MSLPEPNQILSARKLNRESNGVMKKERKKEEEKKKEKKSDPGKDQYCAGFLGQTRVSDQWS